MQFSNVLCSYLLNNVSKDTLSQLVVNAVKLDIYIKFAFKANNITHNVFMILLYFVNRIRNTLMYFGY